MKVDFSLGKFPATEELKRESGLPFGLVLTPLAETQTLSKEENEEDNVEDAGIIRCSHCFAYINPYCGFSPNAWLCSLCHSTNYFDRKFRARYGDTVIRRPIELTSNSIDIPWKESPLEEDDDDGENQQEKTIPEGTPVYVALIDTLCDEDSLESIKSALVTAMDALPSEALFGLITFDDKIRLYDVTAAVPLCRTVTIVDDLPLLAPLEDICPLDLLLAPVGSNKDSILKTLDLLRNSQDKDLAYFKQFGNLINAPSQPNIHRSDESVPCRGQALGTVLQALLQYLHPLQSVKGGQAQEGDVMLCAQILTFLCGAPTFGLGSLLNYMITKQNLASKRKPKPSVSEEKAEKDEALHKEAQSVLEFYDQIALVAASLGVSIDLFALCQYPIGLELLSSLATHTGGSVWLYKNPADAMLTQVTLLSTAEDLFRRLSMVNAQGCLLRVRNSSGLKISKVYGPLLKDPVYEDVYHMLTCDAYKTVGLDFEYSSRQLLEIEAPHTVQIAFQYSVPVFHPSKDGTRSLWQLQRRLRVSTVQVAATMDKTELYENVQISATSALLLHKVLIARETEGFRKGALLLQDWLIILASRVSQDSAQAFESRALFQPLIRFVYGLLRSSLLLGGQLHNDDDQEVFLRLLWSSLPSEDLTVAVYPNLISFTSIVAKGRAHVALSRMAMESTKAPVFIMDSFETVALYYCQDCAPEVIFPPPPGSLIRQTVNDLRQNRKLAPKYITLREEDDMARKFVDHLLDEPLLEMHDLEGESGVVFTGYLNFLEWVKSASEHYIKELVETA